VTERLERVTREGFRFLMEPVMAEFLGAEILPALDDVERRPGVTLVKRNNVRTVFRVPVDDTAIYLKRYHVRGLSDRVKYLFVPSRAVAEWRAARAMKAAGLPTIFAVLMGEKRTAGFLEDGCLATVEIPGAKDFVPYLIDRLGDPAQKAARAALLDRLAVLVRRFHDAGFKHNDLHSGNLLVTGEPEDAEIHLIDLHTVKIVGRTGRGARSANLAKLLHSLTSGTTRSERLRVLRSYEGRDPVLGEFRAASRRIFRRVLALERRRLLSRAKRCMRRSSSFDLTRVGPYGLWYRREIPFIGPPLAVGDHLLTMQQGGREVLKDSRRSAISRQVMLAPEPWGRVVVKETRCTDLTARLKNAIRAPRGLASWKNGNALVLRKIGAARPLALMMRGRRPFIRESFLLMEDLGDGERLDLYVLRRFAGSLDAAGRAEKRALVRAFALFVGDLHRRGVYHGDLKAVNIFVRVDPAGEPRFLLVDYDQVRFGRVVSRRRRIKNLAQIAASVAVLITRTDRLRFFRSWAPDEEAACSLNVYNRGVERACRKKIVVRMEPIE
jgi:lipopolysaccharide core heptose(I) kinase